MNNMIYVSYSQKDGPIVQRICRSLTEKGIQLFVDYEQMAGGDYAQELIKQIESAEAILFFYSENTENSTWVKHEIEFSLSKNKKIIPLLLSEPKESTWLHFYLESFNWIILDGENINSVADRIIKSLEISSEENCSIPSETLGDVKEDDRTNVPQPKQSNNYDEVPLPKKNHISCGCGIIVILGLIGLFLYFTLFSGSPNSLSYDTVTTSNIDYGQTDSFVLKQREAKLKNLKNRLDELFSGSPNSLSYDTVTTSNIDYGQTDSFVLKQRKAKLKNRVDEQLLRLRKELKNIGRRGNSSSSQSILHNIELILGEDSIPFPQVSINTRQELLKAFRKYQETVYSVLERRIVEMELEARNCHDIESDPAEDLNDSPCDSVPLTVENESAPTISHDEEPIPDKDLNDSPCESAPATFFSILYLLVSFFAGCGLMLLLLRIKKSKNENIKLSSDIASKISIDGDLRKEIESREVYTTHLEKGEYLIDFEDRQDENRHKTFNYKVTTKDCKLVFANFLEESSQNGKTIKCFIAGSKTLQQERDALRAVTCVMYNKWDSKNFRILSYTFEDFKKEHTLVPPQELYNKFIEEEADWALFIIDGEIGGITVDEYRVAMDSFKKNGRPKILALAKVGSENDEKVAEIRDEINKEHQYWTDYTDIVSLKYIFESTLNWDLIRMFQDK